MKVRTKVRNPTASFSEKRLKLLFAIGCIPEDELITQRELAEVTNLNLTTLSYHITNLRQVGLIDRKNKLTKQGEEALRFFKHWDKTFQKKIRAHKIQISINIIRLPKNFTQSKHKILQPFTNGRYKGLKAQLSGATVLFYNSSKVLVKIPDVYGNTNEEILGAIEDSLFQIFAVMHIEFPGIKLGKYEICKFQSMHCAILDSIIAETFLLKKGSCYESEQFSIDNSHGRPELEAENLHNAFDNLGIMMNYEDLARENAKLKKIMCEIKNRFINLESEESYKNAKNVLSEIVNSEQNKEILNYDNNNLRGMPESLQLPKGYGQYFL